MDLQLMKRKVEKSGNFFIGNEEIIYMKAGSVDTTYTELLQFLNENNLQIVERNCLMSVIKKKD